MHTKNYSDYTSRIAALIGIDYASMTSQEQAFIAQYLQTNIDQIWTNTNWIEVCPYGEARFVGNTLEYPNNLTVTDYWTSTALTATANQIANPCDGKVSATSLMETAATSAHKVQQSYTFIPNVTYQTSAYLRANGRNYAYLAVNDGSTTHTSYFNLQAGTIGTAANLSQAATIQQCANGFWLVTVYFTSSATAGAGSVSVQLSTDGSTLSYAGDTTKGIYAWGVVNQQTSFASPSQLIVPFEQLGEDFIDAFFYSWRDYPSASNFPRPQGYTFTPNGVIIIGSAGWTNNYWGYTPPQSFLFGNPVYIYYRKKPTDYSGAAYDATATYAVDEQMLFTGADGVTNYYKCLTATSPGQSPDTTPASWEALLIPDVFFKYIVYAGFADWLLQDGQFDKSDKAMARANEYQLAAFDQLERQNAWLPPMQVRSHVTAQSRFI